LRTTKLKGTGELQLLSNATVRQLRPATSQYLAWDIMVSKPDGEYFDQQRRLICQPCRSTDGVGCSLFATGIAARVGEHVNPSMALLDRQVRALEAESDTHAHEEEMMRPFVELGIYSSTYYETSELQTSYWLYIYYIRYPVIASVPLLRSLGRLQMSEHDVKRDWSNKRLLRATAARIYKILRSP
jgi:hypothetical protein